MAGAECDIPEYNVKKGDNIIEVHITKGDKLTADAVGDSVKRAKEFFARYFPEYKYACFTCHSWLLDEKLKEYLSPDSNIVKFGDMFDRIAQYDSNALLRYLCRWDTNELNLRYAYSSSSFAEKIKAAVLRGRVFHETIGIIEKMNLSITNADLKDFDGFYREIEKNFPLDERRDYADALTLFEDGKYEILYIWDNGINVGFITVWQLREFAFAEHFVIYENFRNRGYGAAALEALKKKYRGIVLEAEPPCEDIQKRRLAFYKRCGFVENDGEYMQPAYREDGSEVRLRIMSYPGALGDFSAVTKEILIKVYSKK
jgi:GNAT superfamily N-acetyltransferase